MMSKPAYLSVEIVTDKPTSGKISIPQVVSVAEQTGLSLTWSQNPVFMSTCLSINSACWVIFSGDFYIELLWKLYFISRTGSEFMDLSSLKPYQNFWPDLSPDCLLMNHQWWFMIKETDNFKTDHGYSIARVVSVAMTRENIHYISPNTWQLSISFPFSSLQEYLYQ